MIDIDAAARATRKYDWCFCGSGRGYRVAINDDGATISKHETDDEAQAACDRLNLIAVLEAIREPSKAMYHAADTAFENGYVDEVYKSMIDALIAEVKA